MTISIDTNNFQNAWGYAVQKLMDFGHNRPADDERSVMIRHAPMSIDLDYSAIIDIYKHRLHPLYPQQQGLEDYIAQFNPMSEQAHKSYIEQPYTYLSRTYKQVRYIAEHHLITKEFNKRIRAVTWNPFEDLGTVSPPCLQSIALTNIGSGRVHMFTHWRSHDMYGAWQWNLIALMDYITREIVEPEGMRIVQYTEFNESAHIYDYNWMDARHVRPLAEAALHMMY